MNNKLGIIGSLSLFLITVLIPKTALAQISIIEAAQETQSDFSTISISFFSLMIICIGSLIAFAVIISSVISHNRKKKKERLERMYGSEK